MGKITHILGRITRAKAYTDSKDWLRRVDITHPSNDMVVVRASMKHSMRPNAKQIRGKVSFINGNIQKEEERQIVPCNCHYAYVPPYLDRVVLILRRLSGRCSHLIVVLISIGRLQGNVIYEKHVSEQTRVTTQELVQYLKVGKRPHYYGSTKPIKEEEQTPTTLEDVHRNDTILE